MLEQLGNGLLLGVIIALGSVALSLLYGVTRIVNFAHGEIIAPKAIISPWAKFTILVTPYKSERATDPKAMITPSNRPFPSCSNKIFS